MSTKERENTIKKETQATSQRRDGIKKWYIRRKNLWDSEEQTMGQNSSFHSFIQSMTFNVEYRRWNVASGNETKGIVKIIPQKAQQCLQFSKANVAAAET